jgi:hypothetical protein
MAPDPQGTWHCVACWDGAADASVGAIAAMLGAWSSDLDNSG